MTISALRITDFRNLAAVDLSSFQQRLNVICGDNGSGKTSLLEAIYYLGLGRSFRSSSSGRLIRHESDKFSIFAQILSDAEQKIPIGVERDTNGDTQLRAAEQDVTSIAEIAAFLPIRMINSQSHQLFEAGPVHRRKYLDWGLFYHSEKFLPIWRNFERVLKQRNAALKEKRPRTEIEVWTSELIKYGQELDTMRREYIQLLAPHIFEFLAVLLPNTANFAITYYPGWNDLTTVSAKFDPNAPRFFDNSVNSSQSGNVNINCSSITADDAAIMANTIANNVPMTNNIANNAAVANSIANNQPIRNTLTAVLATSYFEELRFGHTQYGPHRADLEMTVDGIPVKHILSRGQQKLLICAMILAQGKMLMTHTNKGLVYLIDDLPSELDLLSRTKLISLLAKQNTQIFITAINSNDICQLIDEPIEVFHVEQGNVRTA